MTKLQIKIAELTADKRARQTAQEDVLLENESYLNFQADMHIAKDDVKKLDAIISALMAMKAIVAQDGTKYNIHCYPVAESVFGPVGSRIMALATIAPAMFTTERQNEFSALTGIDYLVGLDTANRIGKPAYFTKTKVEEAIATHGDKKRLGINLVSVCVALGLSTDYAEEITEDKITRWFSQQQKKADDKMLEFTVSKTLNPDNDAFVIED